MSTITHAALIERQVAGFNSATLDDIIAPYAPDARFVLVSAHTLPGSELALEGRDAITRHMERVLKGGIEGVEVDWVAEGSGFLAWRDHGSFGPGIAFSESHTALLNADGLIAEHVIHSVYGRGK